MKRTHAYRRGKKGATTSPPQRKKLSLNPKPGQHKRALFKEIRVAAIYIYILRAAIYRHNPVFDFPYSQAAQDIPGISHQKKKKNFFFRLSIYSSYIGTVQK